MHRRHRRSYRDDADQRWQPGHSRRGSDEHHWAFGQHGQWQHQCGSRQWRCSVADGTIPGGVPAAATDPATGQTIGGSATSGSGSSDVAARPVSVDAADNRRQMVLAILASVLLLALVLGPPLVARTMRSRDGPQA